jgi:hypothetical protein
VLQKQMTIIKTSQKKKPLSAKISIFTHKTINSPDSNTIFIRISPSVENSIKYTDPDGRAAGDEFDSIEDAAFNFAHTYNDDSIATGREYGSTIYSYETGGSKKYFYTIPNRGGKAKPNGDQGTNVSKPGKGQLSVATIHTHGNLDNVDYDSNEHYNANWASAKDEQTASKNALVSYIVGPSSVLSFFNPKTMQARTNRYQNASPVLVSTPENNTIPKDANDLYNPENTNIVDRNNYHKDKYYNGFSQFLNWISGK